LRSGRGPCQDAPRPQHRTRRGWGGLALGDLGGQRDHFEQVVDAHAGLGGDGADNGVTAPVFSNKAVLGQLLLDALGVGVGLIHLVDGDDDGNFGGLGVVDGLDGLGQMPSSAATTRMAISVIIAPRARMEVNASWPGVSRKVMGLPLICT